MIHLHSHPVFYKLKRLEKQTAVIEYTLAGFVVVAIDYLVFVGCFNVLQVGLPISTVVAYLVGFVASFVLNRYWVFRKDASGKPAGYGALRYTLLVIFNLGLTYAALLLLEKAGVSPLVGKFAVYIFLYFWIYIASKFWVFKK